MNAKHLITGLQIIDDHRPLERPTSHVRTSAENILAGDLEWPMSKIVQQRLEELGWERSEDVNGWRYLH